MSPFMFLFITIASMAQTVTVKELEQSRLMSRDSFVTYYTAKGFFSSKDDSAEAYQKQILPFSMYCWQSKETISMDTIEGGIMVIRYFCEDTNSVSFSKISLVFTILLSKVLIQGIRTKISRRYI